MGNFRNRNRNNPAISTASLPDIVFMLLFFFMTVTTIKNEELLVENSLPMANETEKLSKKDRVIEIFVGKVKNSKVDYFQIQMGTQIVNIDELNHAALIALSEIPEELHKVAIVSLKADKKVNMGLINDIKEQLREINLLKINYTVVDGNVF
ncbi:ExbD/TolR family protein [Croceivirga thetidis]|uniref:Biopolymer transporter ExbD n=1 Tax=Croceivirga thetidis TaxID=2721623 RepID=A0ABX1GLA8_9FLAO|nr:biopolymer transporter ExbD [Croceivirga thetidis]NKI30682.1 biopolymer transporter ExbD [Croceivirga thetidis]